MKINKLYLKNFRQFSEISLEFNKNTTILVAGTGKGKTTILDAIRIALWSYVSCFDLAHTAYKNPKNNIIINDIRKTQTSNNVIRQLPVEINVNGDYGIGDLKTWKLYRTSDTKFSKHREDKEAKLLKEWAKTIQIKIRQQNNSIDLPVFSYYGVNRVWEPFLLKNKSRKDITNSPDFYIRTFGYQNCFDPAPAFEHFKAWFVWASESLNEQLLKKMQGKYQINDFLRAQSRVQVVQKAIDAVLKPITGWHTFEYDVIKEKSLVLHHDKNGTLSIEQFKTDIKTVLPMVGDIAYRCIKLNPHLGDEATQKTGGIVLIDEIDKYLPPHWQQIVLNQLQKTFPRIQFIVTANNLQFSLNYEKINVINLNNAS